MISGILDRRRRALFWSTIASAAFHITFLTLLFYAVARIFVPRGTPEVVMQRTVVTIQTAAPSTPAPQRISHPIHQHESSPATTPRHELVKEVVAQASPEPPLHRVVVPSRLERDEAGFAKEVAQLNAQNDPHAIPTIDPASRESTSKTYAFQIPSSLRGQTDGNGIITPVQSWHDAGRDCYYGRYEYTYPDGATESGNIVWPFCFEPGSDPFKQPPHPIPFPLPPIGFRLPSDASLPPIEKNVYEQWAGSNGVSAP
ncbi:MAG TPA: hypothetical protein VMU38_06415 [Candidatus Binatia bacterium]|nr:hypothetical protein [Candidatus Binatia bacterium]